MAKEENEKNIDNKDVPQTVEEKYPEETKRIDRSVRIGRPYFIAAIVVLIILIIVLIGSMFRFSQVRQGFEDRNGMTFYSHQMSPRQDGGSFFFSSSSTNGSTTTSNSAVSGVVTAVNGSSFDVGGGGSKTTINTNGSTTWNTTDKKVSVNDSVIVYGTVSGSTLTATSVQVTNF
jgi:cytoskeletal protein RodZ